MSRQESYRNAVNTFNKGMDKDSGYSHVKPDTYVEAWNAVLLSTTFPGMFELANEPGFVNPVLNALPPNFLLLGMCPIVQDLVVFGISYPFGFSANPPRTVSVIGILQKDTQGMFTWTQVLDDDNPIYWQQGRVREEQRLNFDLRYQIQAVARVDYRGHRKVYWTDGLNPPRCLDLDVDYTLEYNRFVNMAEALQLFDVYQRPYIRYNGYGGEGAIKPGVYQFAARYLNKTLDPTGFGYVSNPIPVVVATRQSGRDEYIGGPHDHPVVSKCLYLTIHNLDPDYDYVELACVYYEEAGSVPQVRLVGRYPIRSNILQVTFDGRFMLEEPLSVADIVRAPVSYAWAKHLLAKDGRLFLSNLGTTPIRDLQALANAIRIRCVYRDIPIDNDDPSYFGDYKEENNTFEYKGYKRGEVYSFGIVGVFRDGTETHVHHIPGFYVEEDIAGSPFFASAFRYLSPWHYTLPYKSELLYDTVPIVPTPDYYRAYDPLADQYVAMGGRPICHHLMTEARYQPFYYQDPLGNSFIRVMGIQLEGIKEFLDLPENEWLRRNLVQIIVVRQQRNTADNKSCYGQGLCHGYMYQEGRFQDPTRRDTYPHYIYHHCNGETYCYLDQQSPETLEGGVRFYRYLGIDSLDMPDVEVGTFKELKEYYFSQPQNEDAYDDENRNMLPPEYCHECGGLRGMPCIHIDGMVPDLENRSILPMLVIDPFNGNTNIITWNTILHGGSLCNFCRLRPRESPYIDVLTPSGLHKMLTYSAFLCPELVFDKAFYIPSGNGVLVQVADVVCRRPQRHVNALRPEYALFHNGSYRVDNDPPYDGQMRAPYHHIIFDFTHRYEYGNSRWINIISSQKTLWNDAVRTNSDWAALRNRVDNPFRISATRFRGGRKIKINNYETETFLVLETTDDPLWRDNLSASFRYCIILSCQTQLYYLPILPSFGRELLESTIDIISGDPIGGIAGMIGSAEAYRQIRGDNSFRGVFTGRFKTFSYRRYVWDCTKKVVNFFRNPGRYRGLERRERLGDGELWLDMVRNNDYLYTQMYVASPSDAELYGDNDFVVWAAGLPSYYRFLTANKYIVSPMGRSILHPLHMWGNPSDGYKGGELDDDQWVERVVEVDSSLPSETKHLFDLRLVNRAQYGYLDTATYVQVEVLFSLSTLLENATFSPTNYYEDVELKLYDRDNVTPPIFNGDIFITRFAYRAGCNIPAAYVGLKYTEAMKVAFQKSFGVPTAAKYPLLFGGVNMIQRMKRHSYYLLDLNGRVREDYRNTEAMRGRIGIGNFDGHEATEWIASFIDDNMLAGMKLAYTELRELYDPINPSKWGVNLRSLNIYYCESQYNLEYRHRPLDFTSTETTSRGRGNQFNAVRDLQMVRQGVPFYPYDSLDEVFHVSGEYNHSDGYNFQYSFDNALKKYYPRRLGQVDVSTFPTRTIYSEPVDQTSLYGKPDKSERSDKWKQFLPLNYQDLPKEKGEITNLFEHNGTMYIHTEKSLFRVFVNPRTVVQDQGGFSLYMGNSSVFAQEPEEVFAIDGGYCGCLHKWSCAQSPYGYFFWDQNSRKVFQFTDTIEEISRQGMYRWFLEVPDIYRDPPPDGWDDPDSPNYNPNYFNNPANPFARGVIGFWDPIHIRYVLGFKMGASEVVAEDVGDATLQPFPNFIMLAPMPQQPVYFVASARDFDFDNTEVAFGQGLHYFSFRPSERDMGTTCVLSFPNYPVGEAFEYPDQLVFLYPGVYTIEYNLYYHPRVLWRWDYTNCITVQALFQLMVEVGGAVTPLTNVTLAWDQVPVPCRMAVPGLWEPSSPYQDTPQPGQPGVQVVAVQQQVTITPNDILNGNNRLTLFATGQVTVALTCDGCLVRTSGLITPTLPTFPAFSATLRPDLVDTTSQYEQVTGAFPLALQQPAPFLTPQFDAVSVATGEYIAYGRGVRVVLTATVQKPCVQHVGLRVRLALVLALPDGRQVEILRHGAVRTATNTCLETVTFTFFEDTVPETVSSPFYVTPLYTDPAVRLLYSLEVEVTASGVCPGCDQDQYPVVVTFVPALEGQIEIADASQGYPYVEAALSDRLGGYIRICRQGEQVDIWRTTINTNAYHTVSYSPLTKHFISFHNYIPAVVCTNDKDVYSSPNALFNDAVVYLHNVPNYQEGSLLSGRYGVYYDLWIAQPYPFIVQFVVNDQPLMSKIFGNQLVQLYVVDEIIEQGILQYRDFFNFIWCWTEGQSTGPVQLLVYPFDGDELTTNCKIYNQQYQVALPLAANMRVPGDLLASQLERYEPINLYDPLFLNQQMENRPRLRGKYLLVQYQYNNVTYEQPQVTVPPRSRNYKVVLRAITTRYRFSIR